MFPLIFKKSVTLPKIKNRVQRFRVETSIETNGTSVKSEYIYNTNLGFNYETFISESSSICDLEHVMSPSSLVEKDVLHLFSRIRILCQSGYTHRLLIFDRSAYWRIWRQLTWTLPFRYSMFNSMLSPNQKLDFFTAKALLR